MARFFSELHDIKNQALLLLLCQFTEYNRQGMFSGCRGTRKNGAVQKPTSFKTVYIHMYKGRSLEENMGNSCPGNGNGVMKEEEPFSVRSTWGCRCYKSEYAVSTKTEARVLAYVFCSCLCSS